MALVFLTLLALAADSPERPEGLLFGTWTAPEREHLEPVLTAHLNESGEQIFLAKLPIDADLLAIARWWRVGEEGSTHGFLLAPGETGVRCWASDGACPLLRGQTLGQAALELLAQRESPVVDQDAYREAAVFFGAPPAPKQTKELNYGGAFLFLALLVGAGMTGLILPRDAQYSASGWQKIRTLTVWRTGPAAPEGGVDGQW